VPPEELRRIEKALEELIAAREKVVHFANECAGRLHEPTLVTLT
jgi:hypothetical protein